MASENSGQDKGARDLPRDGARFRELYAASPDLMFTVAADGSVSGANPAFFSMTGLAALKPGEFRAQDLAAADKKDTFVLAMSGARSGRAPALFETALLRAGGGSFPAEGTFYPPEAGGGEILGVFRDLTARRAAEAADCQSRKMEALGLLAGGLAHDLNNMLGAIEGYATLGLRKLPATDPLSGDLQEIRRAVAKASVLTRQLLLFSRKHAVQKGAVGAAELLAGVREKLGPALGGGYDLEISAPPGLPALSGDAAQLEQVFVNIALNARDAMPGGGAIRLAAADAGEGRLRISVSDSGSGMPPQVVERIFDPFFTTRERGKGVGLGLSVAYGIVKRHGGRIEVSTAEGKGSEFSVFLPVSAPGPAEKESPAAAAAAKVLIVEDDAPLLDMAARALADAGYKPVKASGVSEALARLKAEGGFSVIFSDIALHDGNAVESADEMLRLAPGACLVLCSGYVQSEETMKFISTRGYAFLLKPYSIDALLGALAGCFKI